MRSQLLRLLCSSITLLSSVTAQDDGLQDCKADCHQNALAFAFQYGFPLSSYGDYVRGFTNETNKLHHARSPATSNDKNLVRPNVDTLYSTAFFDLSQGDLVLDFPELDDRFWLFAFYDLYGNNFANIGSLHGYKSGSYRVTQTKKGYGVFNWSDDNYQGHVQSPTPYGILLVRTGIAGPTNLETVHEFQDRMNLTQIIDDQPESGSSIVPPLDLSIFWEPKFNHHTGKVTLSEAVLNLLAELHASNPARIPQDRVWIDEFLSDAGISNGTWTQPADTNLTMAEVIANMTAVASRQQAGVMQDLGNNWSQPIPAISGDFRSFYNVRQAVAMNGYLQLSADQAIYPSWIVNGNRISEMESDEAFLVTFSGKPEVLETGFWSFTVYNGDLFLVPNDKGTYALSSRDNLTYADGSKIRDQKKSEGEFQILIQPANNPPPKNWTDNWIPAPAGGGKFSMNFRLYGATEMMTNGTYKYPNVTRIKAITGDDVDVSEDSSSKTHATNTATSNSASVIILGILAIVVSKLSIL